MGGVSPPNGEPFPGSRLFLDSILRSNPRFLEANASNPELLDPLLQKRFDIPGADAPMTLLDYLGIDDGSLEDRLYLGRSVLADSIDVGIPDSKFPYLLAVSVSLDSPELASQIANSLVGQFMGADLALQARNARERASFINSLVGDVSVDLRFAEDTLDEFMDSNRLLSSISVAAETTRMRRDLEVQREFYLQTSQTGSALRVG